jgi:hypothetical protein
MKRAIAYVLSILVFASASAASAQVLISRIQTSGASATDEFVELYNASPATTSLAGYSLKKQTLSGSVQTLVSSLPEIAINPFSYFLIASRDYVAINGVQSDFNYTNNSNSLADNNAALLYDAHGALLDAVYWGTIASPTGSPAINPAKNQSLARLPNDMSGNGLDTDDSSVDFVIAPSSPFNSHSLAQPLVATPPLEESTSTPDLSPTSTEETPDFQDQVSTSSTLNWSKLRLNEINSAPSDGNEWVELFNPSAESINTTGLLLCDSTSATSSCKHVTGTIEPNSFLVVDLNTTRYLNNDGDAVKLTQIDGTVLDSFTFAGDVAPKTGQVLALDTGIWKISLTATPGEANIITAPAEAAPKQTSSGGSSSNGSFATPSPTPAAKTSVKKTVADTTRIAFNVTVPEYAAPNELFTLSAVGSADPRGGAISYIWNFGDGTTTTGETVTHAFATSGVFAIATFASSSAGTSGKTTSTITISPEFYTPSNTIKISEVLANPEGEETAEFIELYNNSSSTVSLSLWQFKIKNSNFTIPEHTSIPAKSFAVFYRSATHLSIANTSETLLTLVNAAGNEQDRVVISKTKDGESFARFNTEWQITLTPTPRALNQLSAVAGQVVVAAAKSTASPLVGAVPFTDAGLTNKTPVFATGIVTTVPNIFGKRLIHLATANGGTLAQLPTSWGKPLKTGERVVLTGVFTKTAAGKTYINVKTLTTVGIGPMPSSTPISTLEVDDAVGKLVTIAGDITQVKGNTMYLDDGDGEVLLSLKTGAHISKSNLAVNARVSVTGIVQENNKQFELWPRSDKDIEVITPAPTKTYKDFAAAASSREKTAPVGYYIGAVLGALLVWAVIKKVKKMQN